MKERMVYWKVGDTLCLYRNHAEKESKKQHLPIERVVRGRVK